MNARNCASCRYFNTEWCPENSKNREHFCDDWELNKKFKVCSNCTHFNTDECEKKSVNPTSTCSYWENIDSRQCAGCVLFKKSGCPEKSKSAKYLCVSWTDEKPKKEAVKPSTSFDEDEDPVVVVKRARYDDPVRLSEVGKSDNLPAKYEPDNLPSKEDLREMLRDGSSAVEISESFGMELASAKLPVTYESPQLDILKHHLAVVLGILPTAEIKARMDPTKSAIEALTLLMGTSQELLSEINTRTDPVEIFNRIMEEVLNPAIMNIVSLMTLNLSSARDRLIKYTGEHNRAMVTSVINDIAQDTGKSSKESLKANVTKLQEILGVYNENE